MALATAGDRANVRAWDSVDVFTAVVGSTAPTDTTTALAAAFTPVGLLSEDELTRSLSIDRTELRSLGGKLVRVKRQAQTLTFAFTALENSHKVFTLANPGSTAATVTTVTTRTFRAQTSVEWAMVIQATEGTVVTRLWCPKTEVFSDGDMQLGPSGMYQAPMTAMVYPDSAGILFYEITNDIAASAS